MAGFPNHSYPITIADSSTPKTTLKNVHGVPISGSDYMGIAIALYGTSGSAITERQPSADSVNDTTPRGLDTNNFPYTYDPIDDAWNRVRGNHSGILLASAARTASVNSSDQINYNARGVHVILNVSAYPAAASIVPTIQGYDPLSATYYDILVGSAITATGYTILKIYPGIGEIANGAASDILPQTWRISIAHADTDSITYSVGYQLVI